MNAQNKRLFFENEEDEVTVITLNATDGKDLDVQVIASLEIENYDKEYLAVLPVEGSDEFPEDQLIILVYSEDENGNPLFDGISDERELTEIGQAFAEYFDSQS